MEIRTSREDPRDTQEIGDTPGSTQLTHLAEFPPA